MRKIKDKSGLIAVVLTFVLMMAGILAAMIAMNKHRAPMAAMSLRRIQAQNYTEAAMYEVFNRFRMNAYPYSQWDPDRWVNISKPTERFDPPGDPTGIMLVNDDNEPVVDFPDAGVQAVIDVTEPVAGSGQYKVDIRLDYEKLQLR